MRIPSSRALKREVSVDEPAEIGRQDPKAADHVMGTRPCTIAPGTDANWTADRSPEKSDGYRLGPGAWDDKAPGIALEAVRCSSPLVQPRQPVLYGSGAARSRRLERRGGDAKRSSARRQASFVIDEGL